ncbi:MAG: hypothetical protein AAF430_23035 [Myxococcota bacterium]
MSTKWIEQIRVRSSESTLKSAIPALRKRVDEIAQRVPDAEPLILQHGLYEGDLSVVVIWRNAKRAEKSRDGLLMAEELAGFGPVDHSVWVPLGE